MKRKFPPILLMCIGILILPFEVGQDPLMGTSICVDTDDGHEGIASAYLIDGQCVEEMFYANCSSVKAVAIRTITWNQKYEDTQILFLDIVDMEGNVVASASTRASDLPDNAMNVMIFNNAKLKIGEEYTIRIYSNSNENEPGISVMLNKNKKSDNVYMFNDESKNVNLIIYGDNEDE